MIFCISFKHLSDTTQRINLIHFFIVAKPIKMHEKSLARPAIIMVVLVLLIICGWEIYLRNQGVRITYDDGPPLWADKRARVYTPADQATVFVGSSRIKFDLDIDTWEKGTGRKAIQLACVGSSPLPVLKDLAEDKNFKGRVVVDVIESIFFSPTPLNYERTEPNIRYFKSRTPAQQASFVLNHALESQFVFLDKESFSLDAELDKLPVQNRPGVKSLPSFPREFHDDVTFGRQSKMMPEFLVDTGMQGQVKNIWLLGMNAAKAAPKPKVDPVPGILGILQDVIGKIRARGGDVLFVRPPSSGMYLTVELARFPRAGFWDKMLEATQCRGIHYADDSATAHLTCLEWSHLTPADAVLYTKALIKTLPPSFGGTGQ